MASDIAAIPTTGLNVQLCGDAHLLNFGGFATPERRLIFDVSDFDETLPGPWEWDALRLLASVEIAGRDCGIKRDGRTEAIVAGVRAYREAMRRFARSSPLEVWYSRMNVKHLIALRKRGKIGNPEHPSTKLVRDEDGALCFRSDPPTLQRLTRQDAQAVQARSLVTIYQATLPPHIQVLSARYELADVAIKVAGIGSVGLRCYVALAVADRSDPLVLQVKEATASVLERYLERSVYPNAGQRVVAGQRLMQAASDIFLGWMRDEAGRDYYVRQHHDMKVSVNLRTLRTREFVDYVAHCAWTLARAHARSGDAGAIADLLETDHRFEKACIRFARSYSKQNKRDYRAFCKTA